MPSIDAAPASRFLTGTGSPEGILAAPVGTTYTDAAATAGAVEWTKWSGTGTTGWRVTKGDTGWRSVTSLLESGWSGPAFIRRVGPEVQLNVAGLTRAGTAGTTALIFPSGYVPDRPGGAGQIRSILTNAAATLVVRVSGQTSLIMTAPADTALYGTILTPATDKWPTVLPGIPS